MPAWQLILIQVVMFIGLMLGLRMLFYRQLSAALQRLQALQEEMMEKEAQLKEELRRAQQERAAEVVKGKTEGRLLLDMAKREAETLRTNAEQQAKQEAEKLLARGREELEKARATMLADMEADALRLSTEMVKYTLTQHGKEDFHHHLIDALIEEIRQLSKDRFSVTGNAATVSSSFPLTAEERRQLRTVLSEKLETDVTMEERIDPDLITGLVIQVGSLVIDGSLKNKLRKAIPFVKANRVKGSP